MQSYWISPVTGGYVMAVGKSMAHSTSCCSKIASLYDHCSVPELNAQGVADNAEALRLVGDIRVWACCQVKLQLPASRQLHVSMSMPGSVMGTPFSGPMLTAAQRLVLCRATDCTHGSQQKKVLLAGKMSGTIWVLSPKACWQGGPKLTT